MRVSLLEQARHARMWTRVMVSEKSGGRISVSSLERWEHGTTSPNEEHIDMLCKLYSKTPKELGLDQMDTVVTGQTMDVYQEERQTPMSEPIREALSKNLGSKIFSLIGCFPRRTQQYGELQNEINRMLLAYHGGTIPVYEEIRTQTIRDVALLPLTQSQEMPAMRSRKIDNDLILKHLAAGIAVCWYLRESRDLVFADEVTREYLKILFPLTRSQSELYRKASAELLSQAVMLRGSLAMHLQTSGEEDALLYGARAIHYSTLSGNAELQAYTHRMQAQFLYEAKKYEEALSAARAAEALIKPGNLDKLTQSWIHSALAYCQASCGLEAQSSQKLARDLYSPDVIIPPYMQYNQKILNNCMGVASFCMENYQEAAAFFDEQMALGSVIEAQLDRTKTEAVRDDIDCRDMDLCISLLSTGVQRARSLGSQGWIREAGELYSLLRIVWPRESAIKRLGEEYFHIP